jgi:hypothetical protein
MTFGGAERRRQPVEYRETTTGLGHNPGHNQVVGSNQVPVSARFQRHGEMSEWLKEHAWKAVHWSHVETHRSTFSAAPSAI